MLMYAAVKDSQGNVLNWGKDFKIYGTMDNQIKPTDPEVTWMEMDSQGQQIGIISDIKIKEVEHDTLKDDGDGAIKRFKFGEKDADKEHVHVYADNEAIIPYPFR